MPMTPDRDIISLPESEVCERIATLTGQMMSFWESPHGWAPIEAADLLNRSMLEWQTSLAATLSRWLSSSSDGELILAWANLGALVEGQLKLLLSVYYRDYQNDADAIRRRGRVQDPDECMLQPLRQFFVNKIWIRGTNWNPYVEHVQQRRNAIHAFRHRDLGSFDEWKNYLRLHLSFLRDVNGRLPYPDDDYVPREGGRFRWPSMPRS